MRRWWRDWRVPALVGAQLLMACQVSAAPPSERAFVADMKQRLEAKLKQALEPIDGELLSFRVPAGDGAPEGGTVNLHRIYGFCQNAPEEECERTKSEFVERFRLDPPGVTAESLRLVVRDREYLAYLEGLKGGADKLVIHEQIGDDLYAFLASDGPTTIALVSASTLKDTGLTRQEAWARAHAQTKALLPAVPDAAMLQTDAVVFEGQDYGSGLLLDDAAWRKLASAIGPDLIMTVVSDHFLLVGVMPDGPNLDRFSASVAEDCKQQPRCISPHVYRFRKGKWVIAR